MFNSYYIFSQCNGCALSVSRQAVIVNSGALPNDYFIWDVLPMGGTDIYALRHRATQMFVNLSNGDGNGLIVDSFAPLDSNYLLRLDALDQPGMVAINTSDGSLVFDVAASGGAGTPVILYGWNGDDSPNQIWQMVLAEVYAAAAPVG